MPPELLERLGKFYEQLLFGATKLNHPVLQSPFASDTLSAVFGEVPPIMKSRWGASHLNAFMPTPSSPVHLTKRGLKRSDYEIGNILTHELAHIADFTSKDPELRALINNLNKMYDDPQTKFAESSNVTSKVEHVGWSFRDAMDWIRSGGSNKELLRLDSNVPGTKLVANYIQEKLNASPSIQSKTKIATK